MGMHGDPSLPGRVLGACGRLDLDVLQAVADHRAPALTTLAGAAMRLGSVDVALVVGGLVSMWALVARRVTTTLLPALAAAVAGGVASLVLKQVLRRVRPPASLALVHAAGYSFPSTSTALVAAPTAALLLLMARRSGTAPPPRARIAAVIAAVVAAVGVNALVGWSVVYLGAHWPSDVVAGWLIGAAGGVAVAVGARRLTGRAPWESAHD